MSSHLVAGLAMLALASCQGASAVHEDGSGSTGLKLSGKSVLEGRYVYGLPDEGDFTIPLSLDVAMPGEFSVQDPAMLAGSASVRVEYSKSRNTVLVHLDAKGLPYRPSFHKDFDDSNPFHRDVTTVTDARWQLWLVGTFFGRQHDDLYYRMGNPRTFLGTRYDMAPLGPASPPVEKSYDLVQGNTRQMVGLAPFDPQPNGEVHLQFKLSYDRIKDGSGTPGSVHMILPFDGCEPEALSNYWTSTALPADKFMTWDTFLESIWSGEGIEVMLTAEPATKPQGSAYRPSGFVGWANLYPAVLPERYGMDFCTFGAVIPIKEKSHQLSPWPSVSRRHLCRNVVGP